MSSQMPFTLKDIKFWRRKTLMINDYDPTYKVIYLGNVLTTWAKGDEHAEKPLNILWKNYLSNIKSETIMKLTICNSGLKALTREHGLTEYWSSRITFTGTNKSHPKIFFWIYRHEGRKMKQELRCHAVICSKEKQAKEMQQMLNERLITALREFRQEKKLRQNARLSLIAKSSFSLKNDLHLNLSADKSDSDSSSRSTTGRYIKSVPQMPLRKQLLIKGLANFRQPLERSKSAPKLTAIEEQNDEFEEETEKEVEEEEEEEEEEENADNIDDIDDEEYINFCGSVSSEGRESNSDIIPDDLDSISEQFSSMSVSNRNRKLKSSDCNSVNSGNTINSNSFNSKNDNINIIIVNETNNNYDDDRKGSKFRDDLAEKTFVKEKLKLQAEHLNDLNDEDNLSNESGYSETAEPLIINKTESS